MGRRWLSSFTGDAMRGTGVAISPEFTPTKRYLHLLVGGGDISTRQGVAPLCNGATINTATGENTYELTPITTPDCPRASPTATTRTMRRIAALGKRAASNHPIKQDDRENKYWLTPQDPEKTTEPKTTPPEMTTQTREPPLRGSRQVQVAAYMVAALAHLLICAAISPTWVALTGLLIQGLWWRGTNAAWCLPLLAVPYLCSPMDSISNRLVIIIATTALAALAYTVAKNEQAGERPNKIDPCLLVTHAAIIIGMIIGVNTWTRHLNLATCSFDLGNLDNIMFNLTYGQGQTAPMERNTPDLSHFRVHFSPMLILLTPIYRLASNAGTLLWIQAALVPISTYLCMKMAGAILKNRTEGAAVGAMWLLYPITQYPLFYDMHEIKLYPMWLFACGWALAEKHKVTPWIFALFAIGMKEDIPIVCAPAFVLLGLMTDRKKTGIALGLASAAYFAAVKILWIAPHAENWMNMYSHLNATDLGSLAQVAIKDPERILKQIWQERTMISALMILAPLAFLPLRTIWGPVLLAVPLTIIWLPKRDVFTLMSFHYNFLVAPIALLAALKAIQITQGEVRKKLLVVGVFASLACIPTISILSPFHDFRGGFAMLRLPIKTNPEAQATLREIKEWEEELRWDKHTSIASSEPMAAHISSRYTAYTTRDWKQQVPPTIPKGKWPKYILQIQGETPIKGYHPTRRKKRTVILEKTPTH